MPSVSGYLQLQWGELSAREEEFVPDAAVDGGGTELRLGIRGALFDYDSNCEWKRRTTYVGFACGVHGTRAPSSGAEFKRRC
jgi:hypothetical protein